ncbi:DNA-binding XRE family transcriptional regulator [Streptomyces sp. CG 926]|uniref:helix-turn-helix transcriptional regulator n=1 Tax=Streptomyces sp. CG 926 TaxID=1882405 RepID=UPI000D6AC651|nr:helix-turn-helix transcriptional regulator [Streptomyces sp. CG 926]PWK74529.1 DNA-binding XRE family transcriptional regulator [Streptomyces sp. CG 926]
MRETRQTAGLTQEELVLRAGIERHTLNRIERGHASTRLDTLTVIADVLNVELSELVRLDPNR